MFELLGRMFFLLVLQSNVLIVMVKLFQTVSGGNITRAMHQQKEREKKTVSKHGRTQYWFQNIHTFYEQWNAFTMSVRSQQYQQSIVVGNCECKYNFMCTQEKCVPLNLSFPWTTTKTCFCFFFLLFFFWVSTTVLKPNENAMGK